jgi:CheY-like chemotaxis protein
LRSRKSHEEQRAVALATVDPKMPGMSGVELISALRSQAPTRFGARDQEPAHSPTRDMSANLLTGYAGLDSALAAKNDAGVDRYLEKPWQDAGLIATSWVLMGEWLAASRHDLHFVMREVRDEAGMRTLLRLRYEVYRATAGLTRSVLPVTDAGLDVDAYDAVSRHFGVIEERADASTIVGSLRVVGDATAPAVGSIRSALEGHPELLMRFEARREWPLPLIAPLRPSSNPMPTSYFANVPSGKCTSV